MRFWGAVLSFGKKKHNNENVQNASFLHDNKYFYCRKSCTALVFNKAVGLLRYDAN